MARPTAVASSTVNWRWGILRLSTNIYHEAIVVAYSNSTFAIVESNTAWDHMHCMAISQEAYPFTA
jgi:hypothetical protein